MARDTTALPPGLEPEDEIGFGEHEGPESQGEFAGEPFGRAAQGTYGDEDRDPSYGDHETPTDDLLTLDAEDGVPRTLDTGPRPDESIVEEIVDRLADALDIHPADVVVAADAGIVKLAGMVDSDRMHDAVEELVLGIAGVRAVDNGLVVRDQG
jgi:hypothetical protein